MRSPDRNPFHFFAFLVVCCLFLASCKPIAPADGGDYPAPQDESTSATEAVFVQESAVVYMTFKELVDKADIIVIGRPTNYLGVENTTRDQKDPSREDPNFFGIGQVFQVRVEKYLAGEGPDKIYVIHHRGMIHSPVKDLTDADIDEAIASSTSIPLTLDRQYIMFLFSISKYYSYINKEDLYGGIGHPWRFEISGSGCVTLEDSFREFVKYFPPQNLDDFIFKIDHPEDYQEIPYPAPEIPAKCVPQNQNGAPVSDSSSAYP